MKFFYSVIVAGLLFGAAASQASGESLRCKGDIIDIGDNKADVVTKCGNPEMTDNYCEKVRLEIGKRNGQSLYTDDCENIDVWTYNPGVGQFWTHLYFVRGTLREMKYGDRVKN